MTIYMIRHGQTDWNAQIRMQGQKDIPLNDTGRRQASGNGRALQALLGDDAEKFDFVASPLHRTRETMELIREAMGLARSGYRMDDRLKEVSFGDWEGYTMAELEREMPERVAERELSKWDFIPPGAGCRELRNPLLACRRLAFQRFGANRLRQPWRRHPHAVQDLRRHGCGRGSPWRHSTGSDFEDRERYDRLALGFAFAENGKWPIC